MAKILIVSHYAPSLINFRGEMIRAFVQKGHQVLALGPEKGYEKKLSTLGAEYQQIPLDRTGLNPLKDLGTLRILLQVIKDYHPDIVFSYAIKPVIYGGIAARLMKVPNAFSMITGLGYTFIDGNWKQRFLKKIVQFLYRLALGKNQVVFFQNREDLNFFYEKKIVKPNKGVLIPGSGVDTKFFSYVKPSISPLSFLLIARLIWDKGIGDFVEAARIIKKHHPEVHFRLLGPFDSNPKAIKREQINSWIAEGIIEYLGETDDVRPSLASASVYVLPSFREGTPRSTLEAMALGRPVITTDVPGCRETVQEGVNGFLVPVKNPPLLAQAMDRFIQNPELIIPLGLKSREIAEEKYEVTLVNRIILEKMGLG